MGHIEVISVFNDRSIAKNASIVLSTPLPIYRYGPEDEFYPDLSASGGGNVAVYYQIGNNVSDTFIEPGTASNIGIQKSSIGTASRDHHPVFAPVLSRWIKFKAKELNASPVTFTMNLITVKK